MQPKIVQALEGQVTLRQLESDLQAYSIDGVRPTCVAIPSDEQEVARCLAAASQCDAVVSPRGGGTHMFLGNRPQCLEMTISLERLDQVLEYVPADMTLTVQAGAKLDNLRALLTAHGQMLPLEAPPGATIGGLIAANPTNPGRMAYGGVRDLLLGTRVALADGRLIRTGGRVVKNVAGYDLNKLLVGSLGTLGVMTEATFKLVPIPARQVTLCFAYPSAAAALERAERILNSELIPVGLTLVGPTVDLGLRNPGPWSLLVRLAETETNVAYQSSRLVPADATLEGEAETELWQAVRAYDDPEMARYRVSTVVEDLGRVVAHADQVIAHIGTGTAFLFSPHLDLSELNAGLRHCGGWAVLESAPTQVKQAVDVWGPERPEWRLSRLVKAALDPTRTLNRGRFVGGI